MGPEDDRAMGPEDDRAMGPEDDRAMGPEDDRAMGPEDDRAMGPELAPLVPAGAWTARCRAARQVAVLPGQRRGRGGAQPRRRPEAAGSGPLFARHARLARDARVSRQGPVPAGPAVGAQRPVGGQPRLARTAAPRRAGGPPHRTAVRRRLRGVGVERVVGRVERPVGRDRGPVVLVGHLVVRPDVDGPVAASQPQPAFAAVAAAVTAPAATAALGAIAAVAAIVFRQVVAARPVVRARLEVVVLVRPVLAVAVRPVSVAGIAAGLVTAPVSGRRGVARPLRAGALVVVAVAVVPVPGDAGTLTGPRARGPPALDALGGEVLVGGPGVVIVGVGVGGVTVVVVLGVRSPPVGGSAAALFRL